MTIARHLKRVSLALVTIGSLGSMQFASAEGTLAETTISNTATVSYSVNNVAQNDLSASTSFVVDKRIRFTVSGPATAASGAPGQEYVALAFTITNFTNFAQDFSLLPENENTGTFDGRSDAFDASGLAAYVDAGVIGTYEPGVDVATYVSALAPDATANVIVVGNLPLGATNGEAAHVRLTVRATTAGSNGATVEVESAANNQNGDPDVVIADSGRDNSEAVVAGYYISTAVLTVTKAVSVVWDPFNNTSNPKAIPGAIVEYAITVANAGSSTADDVIVEDPVPSPTTTYVASSITLETNANPGDQTPVADAGSTVGSPVSSISVNAGDIPAGGSAIVRFRVQIVN